MAAIELVSTPLFSDANLQGYWRLEADGTDSGPNGYNLTGTTRGAVTGMFGNGLDFERANLDFISRSDASCPNLEISGSQTWMAWVKPESFTGNITVMSKRSNFGAGKAKQLSVSAAGIPNVYFLGLNLSPAVQADSAISTGTWYFLCFRYDSTANTATLWVNDIKKSVNVTGTPNDSDGDFRIGAVEASGESMDGVIDEAAVFNRALSDTEISDYYTGNYQFGGFFAFF